MSIYVGDLIHARDNSLDKKVVDPICPEWVEVKSISVIEDRLEVALNNPLMQYVLEGGGHTYFAYAYHRTKLFIMLS